MMELHFTDEEMGYLRNAACGNFYPDQPDRFEIILGDKDPEDGGVLLWCNDYLSAKVIAEHYRAADESLRFSRMWDTNALEWVVWLSNKSLDDL